MAKKQILSSSPTIEGLEKQINSFFYSLNYSVNKETLKIENTTKNTDTLNTQYFVIFKKNRYQFFQNI